MLLMFTVHRSAVTRLCSKAHTLDCSVTQDAEALGWVVPYVNIGLKTAFLFGAY